MTLIILFDWKWGKSGNLILICFFNKNFFETCFWKLQNYRGTYPVIFHAQIKAYRKVLLQTYILFCLFLVLLFPPPFNCLFVFGKRLLSLWRCKIQHFFTVFNWIVEKNCTLTQLPARNKSIRHQYNLANNFWRFLHIEELEKNLHE